MPKMKTKKALRLRFRKTGTGKLLRRKAGRRHLLSNKSGKQIRDGRRPALVDRGLVKKYSALMAPDQ